MIGIDLFSGAGGLTLGAKQAGIEVKLAIEIDKHSSQTYSYNNPEVLLLNKDIREINSIPIRRNGESVIVFGGPPCQGFSFSNQKTRNANNRQNWLLFEFFRIVKLIDPLPEWIVFENVKGFLLTEGGFFYKQVCENLKKLGYKTNFSVINATDTGVPQIRNRLFIIGTLGSKEIKFPSKRNKEPITVKEAINDLPVLHNGANTSLLVYRKDPHSEYAKFLRGLLSKCENNIVTKNSEKVIKRYQHIPQGGNWKDIPKYLMRNYEDYERCHTGIYYRLHENNPSIVIGNFRKNMLVHPTQNRGLSVREAARLQSFPDSYIFKGTISFQQQQVGDAVPPLLAKEVFLNTQ